MQTRPINADTAPVPTTGYVQAIDLSGHNRLLFISGQVPRNIEGNVPDGFEAQCRLAWRNLEAQLHAAGMSLDNLVMHRTYLADRRYALENNKVRNEVLADRQTALTIVITGIFNEACLLEVEGIAAA